MTRRHVQIALGLVLVAAGGFLAASPLVVADAFGLPHEKSTQVINLRASWGGTLLGIGAFVVWLPAVKPWLRSVVGLLLWAMAGIGLARGIGFVLDGDPDGRQFVWLVAEVVIVAGCALGLRVMSRRARR